MLLSMEEMGKAYNKVFEYRQKFEFSIPINGIKVIFLFSLPGCKALPPGRTPAF